jgi:hypothetical protein
MRFLFLALFLAGSVLAADLEKPSWHLSVQLHSLHEHTDDLDLTDRTPGLGVMRVSPTHWLLGAGVFRNSVARVAGYGYIGKQWRLGRIYAGGIAGLTHNYNYNNGGIVPLGAVVISVPLADRWTLDLLGIPRVSNYTYTTVHFAVRWQFK